MRPNFLFVGPDKSGSSWLFRVLGTHPEVFLSPAKDIYFFDRYYDRGVDWYLSRFAGATRDHKVVGEICHDYLYSLDAPTRILETLGPDTYLLSCVREPADRAFSDYLNRVRSGSAACDDFATTVRRHPEIVRSGEYSVWIRQYLTHFGPSRVKIAVFDDLCADPQRFLDDITQWLGIAQLPLTEEQRTPARAAAVSRSQLATRALRRGAGAARALGLEALVGRLKSSRRVESVLYKEYDDRPVPPADVMEAIRAEVGCDVAELSNLTGIDLTTRWGYTGP